MSCFECFLWLVPFRLLAEGMAKKAALIAVAPRLLVILDAPVRSSQSWDPKHP